MSGRSIRDAVWSLLSTLAFSGSVGGAIVLFGTRDLEGYEHAFFSLARDTAVEAVQVLGHPVYTLGMGLGVRLPLHSNFGSSPAAGLAPFLPTPVTYWLMLTFAIGSALLVVRHALEPLCGRLVTWVAAVLLFWSVPIVTYTIYNDWPDGAFTYCALVACVFAPHALLALLASQTSERLAGIGALALTGGTGGLIGLSHPGYWPLVAGTLVSASGLALCRFDRPWQDRRTTLALLAIASLLAVAPQIPDLIRELNVPGADMAGLPRYTDSPKGRLIAANLFPFGEVGSRLPFSFLLLALLSLALGLASRPAPSRTLSVGAALLSILLAVGATLPATTALYSPSSLWTLRDSAAAFAILAAAAAAAGLRGGKRVPTGPALAALFLLALQGPVYATQLALTNSDDTLSDLITSPLRDPGVWTRDLTPPGERAELRGLPPPRVWGDRLALWPGVRAAMRGDRMPTTDIADAGYSLVTAWTKQRTMRGLVRPNELLFNQAVDLSSQILCDAKAVAFLQLRYLLAPAASACPPWTRVPGVLVDARWELAVAVDLDSRVWAVPRAAVSDRIGREPALSADSTLLPALLPVSGSTLRVGPRDVEIELADPSAAAGDALVLPVAYDPAWRTTDGTTQSLGGLLAVVDVTRARLTLEFVPDGVALLRATSMTVAQIVALLGFLGLLYVAPRVVDDTAVLPYWRRVRTLWVPWGRRASAIIGPRLRQRRNWLYVVYTAAIIWQLPWREGPDRISLLTAMLLPLAAFATARITQAESVHRVVGGALFAFALVRVAQQGSRSAEALRDPLFWGVIAMIALAVSVAFRRWPFAARTTAALAGACAMVAVLLPDFRGFEPAIPETIDQLDILAALSLLGLWLQAIASGGAPARETGRISAAARGALLAGLILSFTVSVPNAGIEAAWWVVLGILLGLA